MDGWIEVDGRLRPTGLRTIWHFPGGDFCYAEATTDDMSIAFNVAPGQAPPRPLS